MDFVKIPVLDNFRIGHFILALYILALDILARHRQILALDPQ